MTCKEHYSAAVQGLFRASAGPMCKAAGGELVISTKQQLSARPANLHGFTTLLYKLTSIYKRKNP